MLISHKIALDPNNAQATYFAKAAGTARFAYNWALEQWQKQYEAWKADNTLPKPTQYSLRRQLNSVKREQFPVSARSHQVRAADGDYSAGKGIPELFRRTCQIPNLSQERYPRPVHAHQRPV
ncbi:helix-turn-helix domain-containing protein [Candidatus Methylacidiphilum infernorum]|uniref:helix-turn-helix domain-containing protein n=1 Tax=Candidatus Methylacidiphilum infernorum TaxID=511746 RepID=UPI001EE50F06|nr:helix-turn-helix domain-containing protein [Candidatus Methylacidiphilum infernorum]